MTDESGDLGELAFISAFNGQDETVAEHPNDILLRQSLSDAIAAEARIPEEQAKCREREQALIAQQATLVHPDAVAELQIEVEYQQYLHWLVELQLKRAADLARTRLEYWKSLDTPGKWRAEKAKIANGIEGLIYFFRQWLWTSDPRPDSPLSHVPFDPFLFQEELLAELYHHTFVYARDLQILKSRDMGVSWLMLGFDEWAWLTALTATPYLSTLGSRKEDLVDKIGDMDTLFEKLRYMTDRLPSQLLPVGYQSKKHSGFLRHLNPETRSLIKGESANKDFARGGRQTSVKFDEFASWMMDSAAYTAASESTRSRVTVSTPQGKFNTFANIHFKKDGIRTREIELHWRLHPFKDERWYNYQSLRNPKHKIAQELDLDFEGSVAGRLLPMFNELIHVITWSEFAAVIGEDFIPRSWNIGMAQDVGTTPEHPNVTLFAATAQEHSVAAGMIFVFKEILFEEGGYPALVGKEMHDYVNEAGIGNQLMLQLISHEAGSEMKEYNEQYGFGFEKWDTEQGYTQGYAQLQDYLLPDKKRRHLFRPDVTDEKGLPLGCPMVFFVVPDAQGACYQDEKGRWKVNPAENADGLARVRAELPSIHIPQSEEGKPVRARRHFKRFDDAFDTLRALAAQWPPIAPRTPDQVIENKLPKQMQQENVKQFLADNQMAGFIALRQKVRQIIDEENLEAPADSFDGQRQRRGNFRNRFSR